MALIYTLQMLHILPYYLGPVAFWISPCWEPSSGIHLPGVARRHPDAAHHAPSGWMFMVIISGLSLLFALLSVMGASSWKPWRQRFSSAASS